MTQSVEFLRRDTLFLIRELLEFIVSNIVPVFISSPLDLFSYTKFSRLMLMNISESDNEHYEQHLYVYHA